MSISAPLPSQVLLPSMQRAILLVQTDADDYLKTTVKDKANHAVILDKATSDKLYKDVQSYRLITVATLVDRLKINGSLARKALNDLEEKGQIKKVVGHSKLSIYSMCHYLQPTFKIQKILLNETLTLSTARAVTAAE